MSNTLPYRVVYNQDCTNLFAVTEGPVTPAHVDAMVDEVAAGGAQALLINPNAQRVNYPSRVRQTFWDGYAPGDRAFFGPVPDDQIPKREAWVAKMKGLAEGGCDYLARALARCRQRGLVPGVSVRMNDMHDAPTPGTHLFSRFYMEHPEWRLDPPHPGGGWGARGLDYSHRGVRDHYLELLRELVERYDFDLLELDFLRFQCYVPRDRVAESAAVMTGFLREVRALLDGTGRAIALVPRVGATPASALEMGFDVAAWAREGLVQGITAAAFLVTPWALGIESFRAAVGDRVPVFAGLEYAADRRPGLPARHMPVDPALLRGFAAGHLAAGAAGIHVFNFFCAREEAARREPRFDVLRELGDLGGLRGREKRVTVTSGWTVADTDGPVQVPQEVAGQDRAFELMLCAEPPGTPVMAEVFYTGGEAEGPARLRLHVNAVPAGPGRAGAVPAGEGVRCACFAVPAEALKDGRNVLALRCEGKPVTVVSLDVHAGGFG